MKSKWLWALLGVLAVVGVYAGTVLATPPSGQTTTTLAKAPFDPLSLKASTDPANIWRAKIKTHGLSDLYVVDNTFAANGGTSGWHSHPGPSLIFVVSGTITNYMSGGHDCMQHDYTAGQGFVDEGGDMVHMVKNNGSVAARTIAVQFLPAGATRRIDMPDPGNCP
jgi:quercetin dioxygenase-like cupin family protein